MLRNQVFGKTFFFLVPTNFEIVPPGVNLSTATTAASAEAPLSSLEPCSSATLSESEFSHFYFLHHRRQELQSIIKLNFPQIRLKIKREHKSPSYSAPHTTKNLVNMQLLFISNKNSLPIIQVLTLRFLLYVLVLLYVLFEIFCSNFTYTYGTMAFFYFLLHEK